MPPKMLVRYEFNFTQEGVLVYQGQQTAFWMQVEVPTEVRESA